MAVRTTQMWARSSIRGYLCSSVFICVPLAFLPAQSTAAEISLKDDLGRQVELKEPAQRIVALAPFLTELVFTAGAGKRVVGVSAYSDYPPEAKKLPQVSSALSWSIEEIAALKPDLVLAWRDNTRVEDVSRLALFGIAVYVADARNFEDVPRTLRAIGTLTGHDTTAAAATYQQKLERLRAQYAPKAKVTALLEIWHQPLTTIAGHHFMNEALEICGARNVFSELAGVAPVVSWEEVLLRDPDVIVGINSASGEKDFRANWSDRPSLRAVREGHLVYADADRLQRLTARTPDGVASLCASIDRVRPPAPKR
jgi:iron complex transport system substrate-binding protein